MKKKDKLIYLGVVLVFLAVWAIAATGIETDVSEVGQPPHKIRGIFGINHPFFSLNTSTVLNTWIVIAILVGLSYFAGRSLEELPGRLQAVLELLVDSFDSLCRDTLGEELGRKYVPFIATVFIFVLLSNWIGIIPLAFLEEPTADLNTTLGLGIICFFVAHISGIKHKGWKGYLEGYIEPGGVMGWCMLPMNIVGEVAKVGSHSIRLFGNIMGGSVLILVLLALSKQFIGVYLIFQPFFGIFVGLVQAFVFAMLALAYISVKVT